MRRLLTVVASLGVASLAGVPLRAQGVLWTVRTGDVRVVCPLTIGGRFEAKTTMLTGAVRPGADPADPWVGEFVVALDTLDTGINLRNDHLRDIYLELGKGPEFARAVLTEVRLAGLDTVMPNGKGTFRARLRLHGVERPVMGPAELRRSGSGVRVRASFPVGLEQFQIAKPRYLGVGVADEVTVQVAFDIAPENVR